MGSQRVRHNWVTKHNLIVTEANKSLYQATHFKNTSNIHQNENIMGYKWILNKVENLEHSGIKQKKTIKIHKRKKLTKHLERYSKPRILWPSHCFPDFLDHRNHLLKNKSNNKKEMHIQANKGKRNTVPGTQEVRNKCLRNKWWKEKITHSTAKCRTWSLPITFLKPHVFLTYVGTQIHTHTYTSHISLYHHSKKHLDLGV